MRRRALLVALCLFVGACGTDEAQQQPDAAGTEAPASSMTSSASPTTTPPAITTTLAVTTTADDWDSIKSWVGGPAGEYRTRVFQPPFRFTTTGALSSIIVCQEVEAIVRVSDGSFYGIWAYRFDTGGVDEARAFLEEHPAISVSSSVPVEVGGAPGVVLSADLVENLVLGPFCEATFQIEIGSAVDIYILDVAGKTVTILVESVPRVPAEDITAIIESIEWKDLSGD